MKRISIIIPAYNEEKRIGRTLKEYSEYFEKIRKEKKADYRILIVINNTIDKTQNEVDKFSRKNNRISSLNLKPGGKGLAIMEGFKETMKNGSDIIGFVDADMATSPKEFWKLIEHLGGKDGIIASRGLKESKIKMSAYRKITHRGFNLVVRLILHIPHQDTQCGAKVFTKKTIQEIINGRIITQWAFDVDLLYKLRKKNIAEFPTVWEDKEGSKISLRTPIKMFASVIRLRLIHSPFSFVIRAYEKLPERIKIHSL